MLPIRAFLPSAVAAVGLLTVSVPQPLFAGSDAEKALESDLKGIYTITKRATLSPDRITQPGRVLVFQQDGVTADLSSDVRYSVTKINSGALGEEGGLVPAVFGKKRSRTFKKGERVYVTGLDVRDDGFLFKVLSCDMFDINEKGSTEQRRYMAALKFELPKGEAETLTPEKVKALVDPVMRPEDEVESAEPPTVKLGQTPEEVETILGKPKRVVDLGTKVTYVYDDLKVIFVDGKVSDVQ